MRLHDKYRYFPSAAVDWKWKACELFFYKDLIDWLIDLVCSSGWSRGRGGGWRAGEEGERRAWSHDPDNMTWTETKNWKLNWLSHSCTPSLWTLKNKNQGVLVRKIVVLKWKALGGVGRGCLDSYSRSYVIDGVSQLFSLHFYERGCFYTKPGGLQNWQKLVTLAEFLK